MRLVAVLAALMLASCAGNPAGSALVCPPIVDYPQEVQNRFADETARLDPNSSIVRFLGDYHALRLAIEEACGRNQRTNP